MLYKGVPTELTRQVPPGAVRSRAESLGWRHVENVNGKVTVYHSPNDVLRQVLIPLDPTLDDYGERIAEAVDTLARFEGRPSQDVLRQLLLPPADLLSLTPQGPQAEAGIVPIRVAADLLAGIQQALAAVAASVLHPRPCHDGGFPPQAERLVEACLLVQAERASPTVQVACPLNAVFWEAHQAGSEPPFTRAVTLGLMETLDRLAAAADRGRSQDMLPSSRAPLLSANLCEALAYLRPLDRRASLVVSASWCAGVLLPADRAAPATVLLRPEAFDAAERLATLLRLSDRSQPAWHVGFVEALHGRPGPDDRPAGTVQVAVNQAEGVLHARIELPAEEYALASEAHLSNIPVYFRGVLHRAPGLNRVEQVGPFLLVQRPSLAHAS